MSIRPILFPAAAVATASLTLATVAGAEPSFSLHVEGAAAHAVNEEKAAQFGWGGATVVAPELALHPTFGLELAVGAVVLSGQADAPVPEGVAPTDLGLAGFATIGPRVRPFATLGHEGIFNVDGIWMSGGFGGAVTDGAFRPAAYAAIGYDAGNEAFAAGPFAGYFHMIEPDEGSLRPDDAKIAIVGLHGAVLPASKKRPAEPGDRDEDGVSDASDRCPDIKEDTDGFEDGDGCPDADDDKDGIVDASDACPRDAEDKDGVDDADGCPDDDADQDGIADAHDACKDEAEDKDGLADDDGCPEFDVDGDAVGDDQDACDGEMETYNGYFDTDGCPDTKDLHVDGDTIVLDERVLFQTDSADISVKSWQLMARVAEFLNSHPQYEAIAVSGHADDTGTEDYNQKLSEARAYSVKTFLVRLGVASARFEVSAFGETQPSADGSTVEARAKNRRVEFAIVKRSAL